MKYFIDSEFDGHLGNTLSFAIVAEDGRDMYVILSNKATDPWVIENVIPVLNSHKAKQFFYLQSEDMLGDKIEEFLRGDTNPILYADSFSDIRIVSRALITGEDGNYIDRNINAVKIKVLNVESYPTDLPDMIQHNAWCDAHALKHKLFPE